MRKYILELSLAVLLYLVMFSCFSTEFWTTLWTELWTELGNRLEEVAPRWTCLEPLVGWLESLPDFLRQLYAWSNQSDGFLTMLATVVIAIFTAQLWKETKLTRLNQAELKRQGRDITSLQNQQIQIWQQLAEDISVLNKNFNSAVGDNKTKAWNDEIQGFFSKSYVFPKEISGPIKELAEIANRFCDLDSNLKTLSSKELEEYDERSKELYHKLNAVEFAIKEYIHDKIHGKK